jgi:hypothetical protein
MTDDAAVTPEADSGLLDLWARLFAMARSGETETLAAYVDGGIPVNLTNDKGDSLLMLAAYHGHSDTVSALLARGADPNRLNDRGQSPLAGAVFKAEVEVIKVLLSDEADQHLGQPSAREIARMFGREELLP